MDGLRFVLEPQGPADARAWLNRELERLQPQDPIFDAWEPEVRFPRRRRRSYTPLLMVAALALALTACGHGGEAEELAGDAILVQLEPGAAPPKAALTADGPPIVPLQQVGSDDEAPLLRVPIAAGADPIAAADAAAARPGVAFAEPIRVYRPSKTPNDPRFRDLWGLTKINAETAWAHTTGSSDVVVAVVDDGVALTHPDLHRNLWVNPGEIAGNGQDDDGDGYVDDVNGYDFVDDKGDPAPAASGAERWHGTHVAGTIGAVGDNRLGVVGVNWKVSLMALRAIGPQGGRSDQLAKAIDFAASHGARVINASWGGGGSSRVLSGAIGRAGKHGALFVVAAGNDGAAKPSFPANLRLDSLISVGATAPDDTLAPFSNRGAMVAAPGVGILSTTAPGQYERYDGTSMATPHVAGLAALLWAANPQATLAQVRGAILASGVAVDGVEHGRIDAGRALAALDGHGGGDAGSLGLSREELTFSLRGGRKPRAQMVSVRSTGGGRIRFTAEADAPFVVLSKSAGETPQRVSVRIDPSQLGSASEAHVQFRDPDGNGRVLTVHVRRTAGTAIQVAGEGCRYEAGVLHAVAGGGCSLRAAAGEAPGVAWILPHDVRHAGGRLDAQFVRAGSYTLFVSADEGEVDPVPVVVEQPR